MTARKDKKSTELAEVMLSAIIGNIGAFTGYSSAAKRYYIYIYIYMYMFIPFVKHC